MQRYGYGVRHSDRVYCCWVFIDDDMNLQAIERKRYEKRVGTFHSVYVRLLVGSYHHQ